MSIDERNRANAQHSTGPKTEEGKAKSAQNARRHGLFSVRLHVPEDRREEFGELCQALVNELRPNGELQLQFFDQALHSAWNVNVARDLLGEALTSRDEKRIAAANRFVAQYERSFARALDELRKLQTDFALRTLDEYTPIMGLPLVCDMSKISNEATKLVRNARFRQERTQKLQDVGLIFRKLSIAKSGKHQERAAA